MTQNEYQPNDASEVRSVQRYVSWMFPDKEVQRFRKGDETDIDILITTQLRTIDPHSPAFSVTDTPYTIYYDGSSYDDAELAQEKFIRLLTIGMTPGARDEPGHKNRIPFWLWPDGGTPPPNEDAVMGYLRIRDVSSRIIEQEEQGRYTAVWSFRAMSFRVTRDDSGLPTLVNVNISGGVNPNG